MANPPKSTENDLNLAFFENIIRDLMVQNRAMRDQLEYIRDYARESAKYCEMTDGHYERFIIIAGRCAGALGVSRTTYGEELKKSVAGCGDFG